MENPLDSCNVARRSYLFYKVTLPFAHDVISAEIWGYLTVTVNVTVAPPAYLPATSATVAVSVVVPALSAVNVWGVTPSYFEAPM